MWTQLSQEIKNEYMEKKSEIENPRMSRKAVRNELKNANF